MPVLSGNKALDQALPQNRQLAFEGAAIAKLEQTQTFIISHGQHRAQGRSDSFREETITPLRCRRRIAKDAGERFAKPTLRSEAAAIACIFHPFAFSHLAQCPPHPPRAMGGLESHAVIALELSARGGRINRE